ncbi:hypothetical protein, partial [Serratia marcescens]|uniref:hypothetical protein n=1 Tax=Serratia marcescens TaxID=615 RepID=UPI00195362FB
VAESSIAIAMGSGMYTSFFITSLLLLAPVVWTAAKQDKSDLELITEDFQILARITNAAFLE